MSNSGAQERRDRLVGFSLAAGALLVAYTGGLVTPSNWLTPSQSPSVFPAGCLLGIAICGLIIARGKAASSNLGNAATVTVKAVIMGLVMAVYAIALPIVGLIISTVALLFVLPLLFGYRRWLAIALFGAIIIAASWLIFIKVMGVPLKV